MMEASFVSPESNYRSVSEITVIYAIKKVANCDQGSMAALDKLEGWRGCLGAMAFVSVHELAEVPTVGIC